MAKVLLKIQAQVMPAVILGTNLYCQRGRARILSRPTPNIMTKSPSAMLQSRTSMPLSRGLLITLDHSVMVIAARMSRG